MASTTVKSSAGDYTTLSAWESDKNGNLVTATEGETVTCFDLEDTTAVVLAGWTCDATYNITIQADGDHAGIWSTSVYRLKVASGFCFDCSLSGGVQFMTVSGIQFENSGAGAHYVGYRSNAAGQSVFEKCIGRCTGTPSSGKGFYGKYSSCDVVYVNCLAYDGWYGFQAEDIGQFYALNCGSYNNGAYGFQSTATSGSNHTYIRNNWAQSNATDYAIASGSWTTADYCAAEDGTDPSTAGGQTGAISFLSEGADDFHLAASGADTVAQDNGTDLSAYGAYSFDDDIDGDTPRVYWSIGPDDGSAASGIEKTVSADAVLVDRFEKTVSADAVLRALIELTLSADSILTDRFGLTVSADSVLKSIVALVASADAVLVDRFEVTTDADGLLVARYALTTGADALLVGTITLTTSADALLVARFTKTLSADADLVGRFLLTVGADAILRGLFAYSIIIARTGYITQLDTETGYTTQLRSRTGYVTQLKSRDGELIG